MPALAPVPGVVKIRMGMTVGADLTTGWHMFFSYGPTPPTSAQLNTAALSVTNQYVTYLAQHAHLDTILTSCVMTDLSSPSGGVGESTGAAAGGLGGDIMPASAAMLVNLHLVRRYRGGKPRIYIPTGVPGNLTSAQQWSSTFLTAYHADFTQFVTGCTNAINVFGTGAGLVNVSYYDGGEWRQDQNGNYHRVPTPRASPHVDAITSWTLNTTLGSQRRRIRSR